jgi:hypothetical protein
LKNELTEIEKAIEVLQDALRNDEGYYNSWKANIAISILDELNIRPGGRDHDRANRAAVRFLNILAPPIARKGK